MTNQQHTQEQDIETTLHLPVRQEVLQVGKRVVDTGRGVRIHKTVTETELRIDEPLMQQALDIEYVTINAWVEGTPPQQRHEGSTLIVPVLEEVLVVEKRLRLKEEIRITARAVQHLASERVTLREEQVTIQRFDESGSAAPP
jgi:uncharacterized protein (TIGR02271 family)